MRLFNRYFSGFDSLLVLGDLACVLGVSVMVRFVLPSTQLPDNNPWPGSVLHATAMALVVVVALYYSDLYAIDQTLSVEELRDQASQSLADFAMGKVNADEMNARARKATKRASRHDAGAGY